MAAFIFILGSAVGAACVYWTLCLVAAVRWRLRGRRQSPAESSFTPPVSVLKPVCGLDPDQYASFETFCRQDYPEYEILFGSLDTEDAGLAAARVLAKEHPERQIHIVAGGRKLGRNYKVSTLHMLAQSARHDLLVLCDSDMRVGPEYLRKVVQPFSSPDVGLVTCPYRGCMPRNLAARLEALGIGADFMPSVFLTEWLWGTRFAFGSTIVVRKDALEAMGGFEALADELADDYRLGMGVRAAGYRILLSEYVVDDVLGAESFAAMWARRLRWARTARVLQPVGWAGSFITHGTPLAIAFAAATGFSTAGWAALGLCLIVRMVTATGTARLLGDANLPRLLPLLPISDLVNFLLWVLSFAGNTVEWRGHTFRLGAGGRLEEVVTAKPSAEGGIVNGCDPPGRDGL
ncbi:MAG: bacteriohopanetetrol glucosamine biosynthesis glycosyltransferase HpnI [Chthonomonadales bacterium]